MYIFATQLTHKAIISLQLGGMIGVVQDFIVEPATLELVAFRCFAPELELEQPILFLRDVREIGSDCILVDDAEALASAGDVVRIQRLLDSGFHLAGTRVVTESGVYLGRVKDYTLNLETYKVQRLTIQPQPWKRLLTESYLVDREQIVDVTKERICVRDAAIPVTRKRAVGLTAPTK